jgi:hypothetical protein
MRDKKINQSSSAFRQALLKSEKKRIFAVVAFALFFAILAAVRIFVFGSAMSRWGLVTAAALIGFEFGLLWLVDRALQLGKDVLPFVWYCTLTLESLFPAVGVALTLSAEIHPDYRPLATPWVLAFFPLILLSVLRLSPRLCYFSGVASAIEYLTAAYISGWHLRLGLHGFTVTQTAVLYFGFLLLASGVVAAVVASEIRSYVEAALREAEAQHQLKQVEHELQIARSVQLSLLPKLRPQIPGFAVAGWSQAADDTGGSWPMADGSYSWPM